MANLTGKSVITIDDLTNEAIEDVFELADKIRDDPRRFYGQLSGSVMASLFYEPSTRTRLSFESAWQKLGGSVVAAWDPAALSVAKGESFSDTARVIGSYVDMLLVRHPSEGAARLAKERVNIPVINAGDGAHEHPTQTLVDLYTLRSKFRLKGMDIAIVGDLRYGRTIHSLIYALARFGANVTLLPAAANLGLPENLQRKLENDYNVEVTSKKLRETPFEAFYKSDVSHRRGKSLDVVYIGASEPNYNDMSVYVTRAQKERWLSKDSELPFYPKVTPKLMALPEYRNTSILHPLPRVDEISSELDDDPRSLYFEQAALGVPVRMALILSILGGQDERFVPTVSGLVHNSSGLNVPAHLYRIHMPAEGYECDNENCISRLEKQIRPKFFVIADERVRAYIIRCCYCDSDFVATVYGIKRGRRYHDVNELSHHAPLDDEAVVFFRGREDAEKAGFRASSPRTRRAPSNRGMWPPVPQEDDAVSAVRSGASQS
jgi:aspartate carbamoyltransferase catalytic subunit